MSTSAVQPEALWNDLNGRMREFIRKRVPSDHDAEDVLQDVFVRIHERHGGVRDSATIVAWVFTIARHAITDYYRAQGARHKREQSQPVQQQESLTFDRDENASAELARCMKPFVEQLPERYRQAVTLTDFDGLTHEQAAEQLGLSISGCKSRVQRGRAMVRDMLLDCCAVELDRRRGVVGYSRRDKPDCDSCDK